jgi:23S rRNA pseudouridine955/2504/2580 synthase
MSGVQTIEVTDGDADRRLDRWFRQHFPELPHGRLEKLLRTGQIRIDGARAKSSTRLEAGQQIRVPPLGTAPAVRPRKSRAADPADPADLEWVQGLVIYRDDDVIAINKPPGLAVQGGTGLRRHLDAMLDGLAFDAPERPRLVHRLDKDTSGVLLLGRTAKATARLTASFKSREAEKTYWALVVGVPAERDGQIDMEIAKRVVGTGTPGERMAPVAGGRRAITDYAVMDTAGSKVAWLALRPLTGRTHQLRVHCTALGTPVLGDGKYGGRQAFPAGIPGTLRLHLHARALRMPHPGGGSLEIAAEMPAELAATWRFFGFDPAATVDPFRDRAS